LTRLLWRLFGFLGFFFAFMPFIRAVLKKPMPLFDPAPASLEPDHRDPPPNAARADAFLASIPAGAAKG
jgi:hypothetical protein